MKRTLQIFITFLLPAISFSQDSLVYNTFPVIDGRITYTNIVEIDSTNKNELFTKVKDWAVHSYKSQKATLQTEDKEAGYVVYQGFLIVGLTADGQKDQAQLWHTLKFFIKDNKLKIVFTDLSTQLNNGLNIALFGRESEKIPLEQYGNDLQKMTVKKRTKLELRYKENAKIIDNSIRLFLESIADNLKKRKSDFDF